jgi:glycosyltransferase involved in cell wall biosynthesis
MTEGNPPRRLVVLQVLPALAAGGVERGTVEIVQAIVAAGGSALVASAGGRLVEAVERAGGHHIPMPLDRRSPLALWRNAGRLAELIAAEGVTIVHARSRAPAWSAWLAARRRGCHFVTTYHAPYGEGWWGKHAYNAVMAKGEMVIAISNFIARLIAERYGIAASRVRVIPRGVDPAAFDPGMVAEERVTALARAWRLPAGVPVLLLPARFSRWKGQREAVTALARLDHREAVLVLAGSEAKRASYARELTALAVRLGVAKRVFDVGHVADMPAALRLATLVLSPSVAPEGFGRTVIEAQAMARPVVATDHGGAAETVQHGKTGWLVPPGDGEALARTLDAALALPEAARAALGVAARAAVMNGYTLQAMRAATLDVYRDLLAAGDGW